MPAAKLSWGGRMALEFAGRASRESNPILQPDARIISDVRYFNRLVSSYHCQPGVNIRFFYPYSRGGPVKSLAQVMNQFSFQSKGADLCTVSKLDSFRRMYVSADHIQNLRADGTCLRTCYYDNDVDDHHIGFIFSKKETLPGFLDRIVPARLRNY